QVPPFNQVGYDASQFFIDVILVNRALKILFAAASAGADSRPDHPSHHLKMAVAKVSQLLVYLDQGVKEGKGKPEQRFVTVKHDKKSSAKGNRREIARAALEKCFVEFVQQLLLFIAIGQACFI